MKKPDNPALLKEAVRWACWVFENTDMPKRKVLQRTAQRFGIPAVAVERAVIAEKGKEYLGERAERMLAMYRPKYAAPSCSSARTMRPYDKHWKNL